VSYEFVTLKQQGSIECFAERMRLGPCAILVRHSCASLMCRLHTNSCVGVVRHSCAGFVRHCAGFVWIFVQTLAAPHGCCLHHIMPSCSLFQLKSSAEYACWCGCVHVGALMGTAKSSRYGCDNTLRRGGSVTQPTALIADVGVGGGSAGRGND
jgi:hypothetical protein